MMTNEELIELAINDNLANSKGEESFARSFFSDRDKFMVKLQEVLDGKLTQNSMGEFERYLLIIDYYQENPQILDPHLEEIINPIISKCLETILLFDSGKEVSLDDHQINTLSCLFKILYRLAKTRGHKIIVKFFSHQVSHLEPSLNFFHHISEKNPRFRLHWEMRYIMLLWISLIVMIPFDLSRIDSETGENGKLVNRILDTANHYLQSVSKEYEAACLLVMRLLTRKDVCATHLSEYVVWQARKISSASDPFELKGHIKCLAGIFKHGPRDILRASIDDVFPCLQTMDSRLIKNNSLLRKYLTKLAQRIALCSLKVRIASWRYNRGPRILRENLEATSEKTEKSVPIISPSPADLEEEDVEVSDAVEEVLGLLLNNLRDKDTVVRWIAAKGIGRVCNRISKDMADDVVSSIIECMQDDVIVTNGDIIGSDISGADDANWHGSCLALAELTRRGLLLPSRLADVVPWVIRALTFEQRRGNQSMGANVRDASCYVCWSFARAYEPPVIESFATTLATKLVVVSLTDREVSVRRAASAAFQENAGRHGLFPHGIDVVTIADYFSIGNRTNCFLSVILEIMQFEEYRLSLLSHLLNVSVSHWDKNIRHLAAQSLGILSEQLHVPFLSTECIPFLLSMIEENSSALNGYLMALGYLTYGLSKSDPATLKPFYDKIGLTISKIKPELLHSFGSDILREAGLSFIENCANAGILSHATNNSEISGSWWDLILSSLSSSEDHIQLVASQALNAVLKSSPDLDQKKMELFLGNITPSLEKYTRRGFALSFGYIPIEIFNNIHEVVDKLSLASRVESNIHYNDAETRRNSLDSLTRILSASHCIFNNEFDDALFKKICVAYLNGMNDHSIDARGDVGSWIRESSLKGLLECLRIAKTNSNLISNDERLSIFQLVILACIEKIDRVRETAGRVMDEIIKDKEIEVPERVALESILVKDEPIEWISNKATFAIMVNVLHIPCYRDAVLQGFIICIGGLTESLVRNAGNELSKFIEGLPSSGYDKSLTTYSNDIIKSLSIIFSEHIGNERVSIPTIETLDLYLTNGFLNAVTETSYVATVFNCLKKEVFKSKNLKKILAAIKVFGNFASLVEPNESVTYGNIQKLAIDKLILYLAHPYPIVRTCASENLYLVFTSSESEVNPEIEDILLTTDWNQPLDICKSLRERVNGILLE
ncbi:tubulin folding cofactor D C terminal-domain-containing protein [Globomyces pollinis-pini]|nr:tubulin folding cofactor D C terminal-domain-containing protein [Globomyces pollinis-pini]